MVSIGKEDVNNCDICLFKDVKTLGKSKINCYFRH